MQEILDTVRVPPGPVESDEFSLPDLARDNEDWDRAGDPEAEDQPDPGELQYWDISSTILKYILNNIQLL